MFTRVRWLVASTSLLVVVGGLLLGPAAADGTTSSKFVSKRYGFSLTFAGDSARYLLTPASERWSGDSPSPGVDPEFDQINDLKAHSSYRVAAKPLEPTWTLRKWTSFTRSITVPPCKSEPRTLTRTTLDGAPAFLYELKCADGFYYQLAAIHDHRGYFLIYTADAPARGAFIAALRTFRFLAA